MLEGDICTERWSNLYGKVELSVLRGGVICTVRWSYLYCWKELPAL